jgi:hypothetical protein
MYLDYFELFKSDQADKQKNLGKLLLFIPFLKVKFSKFIVAIALSSKTFNAIML